MVQFDPEDLFYKDYINTIGTYPDYIAIEDMEFLNLKERYHVIYFCDAFLKRYRHDKTPENFHKAEIILKGVSESQLSVKELFRYVQHIWALNKVEEPHAYY